MINLVVDTVLSAIADLVFFNKAYYHYIQLQLRTLVFLIQDDSLLVKITVCFG